jgi:hypothetical protein
VRSPEGQNGAIRLWRLRKRSLYVDAEIRSIDGASAFTLAIYYGSTLTWSGRYANRSEAVAAARERRAELEREGWTFHW